MVIKTNIYHVKRAHSQVESRKSATPKSPAENAIANNSKPKWPNLLFRVIALSATLHFWSCCYAKQYCKQVFPGMYFGVKIRGGKECKLQSSYSPVRFMNLVPIN